jgi:hypothetical protein
MAEKLLKAQKNEKMPITVTVPTTLCFSLYTSPHNSEKNTSKLYSEKTYELIKFGECLLSTRSNPFSPLVFYAKTLSLRYITL